MNKDLYICTADYQGGTFGMFRAYTLDEWREQAIDWSDDLEGQASTLRNLYGRSLIAFIEDTWEIRLEKVDTKKLINFLAEESEYCEDYDESELRDFMKKILDILYNVKGGEE